MPNRLRELRKAAGFTQAALGHALGVTHTTVQRWETGKRSLTTTHLEQIATVLACDPEELIAHVPRRRLMAPLVGYVGAGDMYYPEPTSGPWIGFDEVEAPESARELVAVRVRGVSMSPVYRDGDLLYFERGNGFDVESCLSRDCVVQVFQGPAYVKRIERKRGSLQLLSYNPNNEPILDVTVDWAAPIRWVQRL